jgi:hypothetical protein
VQLPTGLSHGMGDEFGGDCEDAFDTNFKVGGKHSCRTEGAYDNFKKIHVNSTSLSMVGGTFRHATIGKTFHFLSLV